MTRTLYRHPAALVPLAMSMAALGVALGYAAVFGTAPQPDEGAAAHTWQLLMAGQVPVIGGFAVRFLPAQPRQALPVIAAQLAAASTAMLPVWWFGW